MKKSITRRTKHTCINYIFFALHLTKGQDITKKEVERMKRLLLIIWNFLFLISQEFNHTLCTLVTTFN